MSQTKSLSPASRNREAQGGIGRMATATSRVVESPISARRANMRDCGNGMSLQALVTPDCFF